MPIASIIFFFKTMVKLALPTIILYIASQIFALNLTMKTACRMSMFASGIFVISGTLFSLFLPQLSIVAELLHMLAAALIVMSFTKT